MGVVRDITISLEFELSVGCVLGPVQFLYLLLPAPFCRNSAKTKQKGTSHCLSPTAAGTETMQLNANYTRQHRIEQRCNSMRMNRDSSRCRRTILSGIYAEIEWRDRGWM